MKFIYVMSQDNADKMSALGYKLLKKASERDVYIFQNKDVRNFALDELDSAGIQFVSTDILTF